MKLYLSVLTIVFFSFNQVDQPLEEKVEKGIIVSVPSETILLSSRPKPVTVEVPTKQEGSYTIEIEGVKNEVKLSPPQVKAVTPTYLMQHYGEDQGVIPEAVLSVALDKMGNLWIGTNGGGLLRYDGNSFVKYAPTEGVFSLAVSAILFSRNNEMWLGYTIDGVSRYDGYTLINYTIKNGLPSNQVQCFCEDEKGNIWIGTVQGLCLYDGRNFKVFNKDNTKNFINNDIRSLAYKNGILWIGTLEGLGKYNGETFKFFTVKEGLAQNNVLSTYVAQNGDLWIGTNGGGISKYDGAFFKNYTTSDGLIDNTVYSILEDQEFNIWFGTGLGASQFDGKSFKSFNAEQGLTTSQINIILKDLDDNLWFGTAGNGLFRFDGESISNFTPEIGFPQSPIRTISQDFKNNLFFGSKNDGLLKYDGKQLTLFTTFQGVPHNYISDIINLGEKGLWLGTYGGGISYFNGSSFVNYTSQQGLLNDYVRSLYKDNKGVLWIGTNLGIIKFDGEKFINFPLKSSGPIRTILEDNKGNLWFGTSKEGLLVYNGKNFSTFGLKQGLPSNLIVDSLKDELGNLWFGTTEGLSRFDGKNFLNFSKEKGLHDKNVYSLGISKENNLVIGTNEGIAILKDFKLSEPYPHLEERIDVQNNLSNEQLKNYTPIFEVYNTKRGYPLTDANASPNNIFLDNQNILWVGTGNKKTNLVRIDTSKIHKSEKPPLVKIKDIKIDNEKIIWGACDSPIQDSQIEEILKFGSPLKDKERVNLKERFCDIKYEGLEPFYYTPDNLVLPYKHNNVTIDFGAIELARPQTILYQYKLEGYDKDWSPPSNKQSVNFGNINEGKYTFKVKALSPYGIWSEPLEYKFKVLPPWYRTWWAYMIYAVTGVSIAYAFYKWRTAKLRKQVEVLENLYAAAERFVPKKVLELLNKKHLEDVQLGDSVKLKISAMFADIRGFTSLSETLTPEQTALFLNTYTYYMAPVIRNNHGFINQFLGDGILALFPDHPEDSVLAALRMIETLPKFNEEIESKGFSKIEVGIGINAGDAMLFALGEKERLDASIVSDAINTASRVEGLNKYYKTKLLISETVYQELQDPNRYLIRIVDKVFLKGKNIGTRIYEVQSDQVTPSDKAYLEEYAKGFSFYENGDFLNAEKTFNRCLQHRPDDGVVKLLATRCANFMESPPLDWDGTIRLSEK